MDVDQLIESLAGRVCPACGQRKVQRRSLCGRCYHRLPFSMQRALYRLVGRGYEAAMDAALKRLGVDVPHWTEKTGA